jgi:hypothetical protein
MVTYAQLETEPEWHREIVTPELDWLGDTLCSRLGRPRGAAGARGDNEHLSGSHRSQEWILRSRYATSRTYTVQAGLAGDAVRHIAGFDMVPGPWGSATNNQLMISHTSRLYSAMRAGRLPEVRELYGTLDGRTVTGLRGGQPASSDLSHLEHWHLSLDRRQCANRSLMERIVAVVFDEEGEDMPTAGEIAEAVWSMESAEYLDSDADGTRQRRTRVDVLHRAEAAAQRADDNATAAAADAAAIRAELAEFREQVVADLASIRAALEPAPPPAE